MRKRNIVLIAVAGAAILGAIIYRPWWTPGQGPTIASPEEQRRNADALRRNLVPRERSTTQAQPGTDEWFVQRAGELYGTK
jgi:hypothetical protein